MYRVIAEEVRGGSHASSLRTLLGVWGLRIAEVADPATRTIVKYKIFLYVIIEPPPWYAASLATRSGAPEPLLGLALRIQAHGGAPDLGDGGLLHSVVARPPVVDRGHEEPQERVAGAAGLEVQEDRLRGSAGKPGGGRGLAQAWRVRRRSS